MSNRMIKSYARTKDPLQLPKLIDVQLQSFESFINESLAELFEEISPIESYNGDLKLYFPCSLPEVEGFDLKYWLPRLAVSCTGWVGFQTIVDKPFIVA